MEKINFDRKFEIYLFTDSLREKTYSMLSEFISYLKYNQASPYYKFSYVGLGDGLIPELSLNENILMNFSPDSLTENKQNQFEDFLKNHQNIKLDELYKQIHSPHEITSQSDSQMKKLTSLIKSLIFEGQFIFLEEPENLLDDNSLEIFIEALKSQISMENINVFIYSREIDLWKTHVDKIVKRNPDFTFRTEIITSGPTNIVSLPKIQQKTHHKKIA